MKIHSICLVKDECDIIKDVLLAANKWSDFIYIYDNGSTDGTTEIVKSLSKEYENIVLYKWSDRSFEDTIRGEVYHAFKDKSQKGDWWCRLDADEFYIDNPVEFIEQIDDNSNTIFHSSYQYYFTDIDLKNYEDNPQEFSYKDLNYYQNNWSEIRFTKDNGNLYWPSYASWPDIIKKVYHKKIRVRHYQYRKPEQIQIRLRNRHKAHKESGKFRHELGSIGSLDKDALLDTSNRIVSHKILNYDQGDDDKLVANPSLSEYSIDHGLAEKFKIGVKNILYRLNLLKYFKPEFFNFSHYKKKEK